MGVGFEENGRFFFFKACLWKEELKNKKLLEAGFSLVLHSLTASLRRALPACAFKNHTQKKYKDKHLKHAASSAALTLVKLKKKRDLKEKLRIAKLFFYMI